MVVGIATVFDTPSVPLAVRMVRPIPIVLLEQVDAVRKVVRRARRPADGAEFADVDMHVIGSLELAHGRQNFPECILVPLLGANHARIGDAGRFVVDTLMRELAGHIHVHLVDHARHVDRFQSPKSAGRIPLTGLDEDRNFRIDGSNGLCRPDLRTPIISQAREDLRHEKCWVT